MQINLSYIIYKLLFIYTVESQLSKVNGSNELRENQKLRNMEGFGKLSLNKLCLNTLT